MTSPGQFANQPTVSEANLILVVLGNSPSVELEVRVPDGRSCAASALSQFMPTLTDRDLRVAFTDLDVRFGRQGTETEFVVLECLSDFVVKHVDDGMVGMPAA